MKYEITKNDLKKLSLNFRNIASRFLTTDYLYGMENLKRFIDCIENTPLIYNYILNNNKTEFDIKKIIKDMEWNQLYSLPNKKEDEIAFTYQLLKYGLDKYDKYFILAKNYEPGGNFQVKTDAFNKNVVLPFVQHIINYFEELIIDMGLDEKKSIHIEVSGGTVGQFNLSQDQSTLFADQTNINNDLSEINNLFKNFINLLKKEDISENDKDEIKELVAIIKEEINSKNPRKSLIKAIFDKLKISLDIFKDGTTIVVTLMAIIDAIKNFIN